VIDAYRRAKTRQRVNLDHVTECLFEDDAFGPEYAALRQESYKDLNAHLQGLPALHRSGERNSASPVGPGSVCLDRHQLLNHVSVRKACHLRDLIAIGQVVPGQLETWQRFLLEKPR
jgi:hypothetical protein